MNARRAIRPWLICMLVWALVACAAGGGAATPTPPAENPAPDVTVVLWHGWSGASRQALVRLVDRFNQRSTAGRVLAQAVPLTSFSAELRAASAARTGPHLVLVPSGWLGSLVADDALLPLDNLLSPSERQALLPVALGAAQARGSDGAQGLYGLPLDFDTLALFYNKENVLLAPETTDDLLSVGRGLSRPGATPALWGLALNLSLDNTIGYMYAFGGRVFDENGQLVLGEEGRAGAEQWLAWLAELHRDEQLLVHPYNGIRVDRELKNQHVFMTFDWAHQIGEYRRIWGDQMGVAPLPRLAANNQPPMPYAQSDILAVNRRVGAAEQRAAIEFLRYMTGEEAQRELLLTTNRQPARKDLRLDGDDPQLVAARAFRAQAELAQPMPNSADRGVLRDELWKMQEAVLAGRASPADAVTAADARLRAALKLPAASSD